MRGSFDTNAEPSGRATRDHVTETIEGCPIRTTEEDHASGDRTVVRSTGGRTDKLTGGKVVVLVLI